MNPDKTKTYFLRQLVLLTIFVQKIQHNLLYKFSMEQTQKQTRPIIARSSARSVRSINVERKPVQAPPVESIEQTLQVKQIQKNQTAQQKPLKPEKQLGDELKKGILFFRLIFKNKRLKNLSLGFSSIRNSIVITLNKAKVMHLKLFKLDITKKQEAIAHAFRKLATNAAKNRRGYLRNKSVLLQAHKLKLLNRLATLLDEKYLQRYRQPLSLFVQKKRIHSRIKALNQSAKIKFFNVLVRSRYREGLHKIKLVAASKARSKLSYLRNCMRIISKKTVRGVQLGFQYIKRIAMYKKAQALKQQEVNKRNVSERQQKLMEQVDQLAVENAEIKKKYEGEIAELEAKRQEMIHRLQELTLKNAEVLASIEEMQQVKKSQLPAFNLVDVYERVYNNFLYFLKYADEEIPKADLLNSLSTPMCRIDMPVDIIRQENQALVEVIEQYRRLNLKLPPQPPREEPLVVKPYEQLLRENSELYSVLGALIQNSVAAQNDKDYVQVVSDFSNLQEEFVKVRKDLDGK